MSAETAKSQALATTRPQFNEMENIQRTVETSMTAAAAESKAMVEARYVMAINRPRVMDTVRQDLLKECSRPSFALDKSALYHKPIGQGGVEGLGIRFAEVAIRCMTNILAESFTISEDDNRRTVKVLILDLESNTSHSKTITVNKTVERSKPKDDGYYVSKRLNTRGEEVFVVPATDDDLLNKEAALISKALRTQVLRLVPGDIQDECENKIREIRKQKIKEDPDAAKRNIIDAFMKFNVKVTDLEKYLDHPLDQVTPAEILNLQALYGALRDEEIISWKYVMDNLEEVRKLTKKPKEGGDEGSGGGESAKKSDKGNEAVKEKVKAEQAAKATTTTAKKTETVKKTTPVTAPAVEKTPPPEEPKQETTPPLPEEAAELVSDAPEDIDLPEEEETPEATVEADLVEEEAGEEKEEEGGAELRGVHFPVKLTWDTEDDKFTEDQLDRANAEAKRLGAKLGPSCQSVLKVELETLNKKAMEKFIEFLKTIVKK